MGKENINKGVETQEIVRGADAGSTPNYQAPDNILEVKEAYISICSYPILWLGEDGYEITRLGRLLIIRPSWYKAINGESEFELHAIIKTGELLEGFIPFIPNNKYIIAGGVDIDLVNVYSILQVNRNKTNPFSNNDFVMAIARGVKDTTYAVCYSYVDFTHEFSKLKVDGNTITYDVDDDTYILSKGEVIAKDYPNTFKLFVKDGKLYLTQIGDC